MRFCRLKLNFNSFFAEVYYKYSIYFWDCRSNYNGLKLVWYSFVTLYMGLVILKNFLTHTIPKLESIVPHGLLSDSPDF
jgi:hypothetical protein